MCRNAGESNVIHYILIPFIRSLSLPLSLLFSSKIVRSDCASPSLPASTWTTSSPPPLHPPSTTCSRNSNRTHSNSQDSRRFSRRTRTPCNRRWPPTSAAWPGITLTNRGTYSVAACAPARIRTCATASTSRRAMRCPAIGTFPTHGIRCKCDAGAPMSTSARCGLT